MYLDQKLKYSETIDELCGDMTRHEQYREEVLDWLISAAGKMHVKPLTIESAIILFDRLLLDSRWQLNRD
jgi:hypothetical protein